MEKHPLHLKTPELQTSPEVNRAVKKQERLSGEKVPNDPSDRIDAYLKRFEKLILDPNKDQKKKDMGDIEQTERPRALSLLREMVLNEYVRPNKAKMAQGAMRVEQNAAHQMGVQVEYTDETLEQRGEIAVGDLESSLDQWITYLSDPNESYPTWFRYYAFKHVLRLGEFDKDRQEFPERSKGTFKLFPDVDRGALAYVEEVMSAAQDDATLARLREAQKEFGTPEADMWTPQKVEAFVRMPFAKQYAEGVKQQGEITPELRAETRGEWVRYRQGDSPKELWKSLQNKGTAWCTRGYPTAETQLKNGDFHVFYTLDATGNPTIPRIAIRMQGDQHIAEDPRGVFDTKQNLEPNMVDILDEKLKEFGSEADAYKKKSEDMRLLTVLEKKQEKNESFTKPDLSFLYELNAKIEGFGYQKDPRIAELRKDRNVEVDMLVIFDCTPDHIAHVPSQITKDTKAYAGQLEPGIFQKLPENLEHVYTSFPEGKVTSRHLELGGFKDGKAFEKAIEAKGMKVSDYTKQLLESPDFRVLGTHQNVDLVELSVQALGFNTSTRYDKVCERAQELGLELCPPEVGPQLRLQYAGSDYLAVAMNPINDRRDGPNVFHVYRDGDGLWLGTADGSAGLTWDPEDRFVFLRPRKGS